MALNKSVVWRVRTGGVETNGGGYDSSIAGGTDYSDQDAPQLSITDLVSTASTTVTSAAGGFTSQMVGNMLRLASASGTPVADSAGSRYLMITAYTDANTVTVDKTSGTYTAGVAKVGGAHASLVNHSNGGAGLATPALTSALLPGHTIYARGAGSEHPSAADWDHSAGYWTFPNGTAADRVTIIGYNGRPRFDHRGLMIYTSQYWIAKNLVFKQITSNFVDQGIVQHFTSVSINCKYDQNGYDSLQAKGTAIRCAFINTGATTAGTEYAFYAFYGSAIFGNVFDSIRGGAIQMGSNGAGTITDNIIRKCKGTSSMGGITATATNYGSTYKNNTIDGGAGDGMRLGSVDISESVIINNIISNHAGSGKYGINCTTGTAATNDATSRGRIDYNNLYGNTTARNALSAGANDLALDPQFTNTGADDYSVGTNMKAVGFPDLFPG